jgi:hypothetical protein
MKPAQRLGRQRRHIGLGQGGTLIIGQQDITPGGIEGHDLIGRQRVLRRLEPGLLRPERLVKPLRRLADPLPVSAPQHHHHAPLALLGQLLHRPLGSGLLLVLRQQRKHVRVQTGRLPELPLMPAQHGHHQQPQQRQPDGTTFRTIAHTLFPGFS